VNGLASTLGAGSQIQATYSWNFGDTGSQYNTLVGFNAAHAYDNAGTYTITLSLTDVNGQTSTATAKVTVLSNSSLTTIYVSPNGNDSNSGTSQDSPIQTVARLNNILTSNERVLFEDGGTYDVATGLGVSNITNVEIGSYGSGAKPILMYDGPSGVFGGIINIGASNVSVTGLTFDSIYKNDFDSQAIHSGFVLTGNNIVIRNNTFLNVLDDFDMSGQPNNVLVENNQSPTTTDLNAYFAWIQGNNIELVGNSAPNSVGESIIRIGGANNVLLADNNFANIAGAGGDTNDISKNVLSIQAGSYAYIYGNILATGPVSAGPLGTPAADPTASFNNVVFDSNQILNSTILLTPGVHNVMARNNLIQADGDAGITISAQEITGAFNWQVQNVYIQNNTVTEPSVWGGLLTISNGEAQDVHVDKNLFVDPSYATGAGAGFIKVDENDMNSFAEISDNVWSIPSSVAKFAQGGYFFVSSDVSAQDGWLTPAEWEATGIPTGDVYENVTLGSTFSTNVDGFTAGSDLPNN
jgi:hypothetical protein